MIWRDVSTWPGPMVQIISLEDVFNLAIVFLALVTVVRWLRGVNRG